MNLMNKLKFYSGNNERVLVFHANNVKIIQNLDQILNL